MNITSTQKEIIKRLVAEASKSSQIVSTLLYIISIKEGLSPLESINEFNSLCVELGAEGHQVDLEEVIRDGLKATKAREDGIEV